MKRNRRDRPTKKQDSFAAPVFSKHDLLRDMKATANRIRELILAMPAEDLLGYIYAQYLLKAIDDQKTSGSAQRSNQYNDLINENQFLLEYVHAVWAADVAPKEVNFDEAKCTEIFELANSLRLQALAFAMASSAQTKSGHFGLDTADLEFHAKSTWVLLRGNRFQVLEGEFYSYVLAPHNDVLLEVYGLSASEIAEGFQSMANATRLGHANAIEVVDRQFKAARSFASSQRKSVRDAVGLWGGENPKDIKAAAFAMDDLLRGGIANVSRHTKLPEMLLKDLAYERGEDTDFFSDDEFAGTPFKTLPARKKPLVKLQSGYYAVDPCLTRDAGYRALLHNLIKRKPEYKKVFEFRQKEMSEHAFKEILATQLQGATVYNEVYYLDPTSKQWYENDTIILVDDVLLLIEAKGGSAATIASPASDFDRHARSVEDLIVKAYRQCERFFGYLNSAESVPIYNLLEGQHVECGRIRRADFRVLLPIGLTIETFSPFSTFCKDLPEIAPLLGEHAFVSMSVDELFVLRRLLPTPGIFAHYMEVRQIVAGMRQAHLFDEFDHLGAYLTKNRFDLDIADQMKSGKTGMLLWNGFSKIVEEYFEGDDWDKKPIPTQKFPKKIENLLEVLDKSRHRGWLKAESHIRSLGNQGRNNLAHMLLEFGSTLGQHGFRNFTIFGDAQPLFVWIQQVGQNTNWQAVNDKASAAALCINASEVVGILVEMHPDGTIVDGRCFPVHVPSEKNAENSHIYEDSYKMSAPHRKVNIDPKTGKTSPMKPMKVGRNHKCPCGSGLKFKRCHGVH